MNYLELCQMVLDEGDRVRWTLSTTVPSDSMSEQEYKVVKWVAQAYKDVQRWSRFFTFHQKSGKFFETVSGKEDYTKRGVREVLEDSFFCVRPGTSSRWELRTLSYKDWRDQFKTVVLAEGTPQWIVRLPNEQFRIVPTPDDAYEIHADWIITLDELQSDYDEPLWDEENHDIVAWQALKYYISEFEAPEELATRVAVALREGKKEFLFRYLPDVEVAV